jgi:iron complex transport system substrate-binding protein
MRRLRAALAAACVVGAEAQAFPVTVDNCGEPLRIAAAPSRAVFHDINMAGMALALGLQDRIVGVTGITGWYKADDAFRAALGSIPELAPRYPTLEALVAARPDLFVAGWYYGMKPGSDVTPATLARHGIPTLVLTESCVHIGRHRPRATMDLLYGDILRLGTVFGREADAERLVEGWRRRIAALQVPGPGTAPRPRVFVYDSGEDRPFTAGAAGMPTALIDAAGGRNVMDDVPSSWTQVSWESVGSRDPQFLIVVDHRNGPGAARVLAGLRANPAMRQTEAVRRGRYIVLRYEELTPGPANIEATEKLARAFRTPAP